MSFKLKYSELAYKRTHLLLMLLESQDSYEKALIMKELSICFTEIDKLVDEETKDFHETERPII